MTLIGLNMVSLIRFHTWFIFENRFAFQQCIFQIQLLSTLVEIYHYSYHFYQAILLNKNVHTLSNMINISMINIFL